MSTANANPDADERQRQLTASFLGCRPVLERVVQKIIKRASGNVDDVVQDTFLRCFEAARKQEIRFPKAFMVRTARNLALNRCQRAEVELVDHVEDSDELDVLTEDGLPHNPVEESCAARERFLVFCDALETLPARCRQAFVLMKVYGLRQSEVAQYLGTSESTVEKQVAKGLFLCREYMSQQPFAKPAAPVKRRATATGRV
jgi:RNA polymerase sigma-70 factor (ECF subfamily)